MPLSAAERQSIISAITKFGIYSYRATYFLDNPPNIVVTDRERNLTVRFYSDTVIVNYNDSPKIRLPIPSKKAGRADALTVSILRVWSEDAANRHQKALDLARTTELVFNAKDMEIVLTAAGEIVHTFTLDILSATPLVAQVQEAHAAFQKLVQKTEKEGRIASVSYLRTPAIVKPYAPAWTPENMQSAFSLAKCEYEVGMSAGRQLAVTSMMDSLLSAAGVSFPEVQANAA